MLMQVALGSQSTAKAIVGGTALFISIIIVAFFHLLTGSWILGLLLYLGLIWWVLRTVGSTIMYPGSSFISRSDIEMRVSKEVGARIVAFVNASILVVNAISQRNYKPHENHFDLSNVIGRHMSGMIDMFQLFQDSLSQRKQRFLAAYRAIQRIYRKSGEAAAIEDFFARPHLINNIPEGQLPQFKQRFIELQDHLKEVLTILRSFTPPEATFDNYKFRVWGERLYEIRFAFHTWKQLYNYQVNLVPTSGKDKLETAVIFNQLQAHPFARSQDKIITDNNTRKCVLFCNPNGVFLQFFGADNQYIKNYLRLGFHVILWNYRGYGQSTGTPSIATCQVDGKAVYDYYRHRGFEIQVVHGYSIGGCAAIGLMEKIRNERRPAADGDVQVLIVDRSFSSIGEMSIEFGDILHRITKVIFVSDNMDLSKHFEEVACRKLLIWDYCDEVIPDRASVKNCIIKRRKRGRWDNGQVGSDVQTVSLQEATEVAEFELTASRLARTLRTLLAPVREAAAASSPDSLSFDSSQTHQTQLSSSLTSNNADRQLILKLMSAVDGGGIQLMQNVEELQKIIAQKPDYFHHICESYVLGIVCYGSYFPLKPIVHDHQKIKEDTLHKIRHFKSGLKDGYQLEEEPNVFNDEAFKVSELAGNVYWIYDKLEQLVGQYYCEEWFGRHGSLLPTNNGHNSALGQHEYQALNQFLRHSLAPSQPQPLQQDMTQESML